MSFSVSYTLVKLVINNDVSGKIKRKKKQIVLPQKVIKEIVKV